MIITEPAQTAANYMEMGITPIPVKPLDKVPTMSGWSEFRPDAAALSDYFTADSNIGLLLGKPSGHMIAIDMDWHECGLLYDLFFPDTPVFGRVVNGIPLARHLLLRCDTKTQTYDAPVGISDKRRIVELLSTGKQVVGPGSVYADGQPIKWIKSPIDSPLADMSPEDITTAIQHLAGAALLARLWADLEGSRHEVLLTVTGALVHAGWDHKLIMTLLARVIQIGGDRQYNDRKKAIVDTLKKAAAGEAFTGLPALSQLLDQAVTDCLVKWWGLSNTDYGLTGLSDQASLGNTTQSSKGTGKVPLTDTATLQITWASDIVTRPIKWLWKGRVPSGKVSLFAGDPGLGKSLLTTSIAAHVTTGKPWPVDMSPCEVGEIMILSAEDDPEDTIVPRLNAAGADIDKVHILGTVTENRNGSARDRGFCIDTDIPLLDAALTQYPDTKVVVIDPVSAHIGRNVDPHNDADVRSLMAPSAKLAAKHRVAIILIAHLNKGGGKALYRVIGSIGFTAAARATYLVTKDPENPATRLVLTGKNNLGPDTDNGLTYTVQADGNSVPYIQWGDQFVTDDADAIFDSDKREGVKPAREEAGEFLLALLQDGPVQVSKVQAEAKAAALCWRTVERSKADIGARSIKRKGVEHGEWEWHIPVQNAGAQK